MAFTIRTTKKYKA